MATEHEAHDGLDALMAAITGEPLPDGAHTDAAFMAEHRAALADVALLRAHLGILGDALADPEARTAARGAEQDTRSPATTNTPGTVTVPHVPHTPPPAGSPRRGRALGIAFGSLAAAAALSVGAGFGWLVAHSGGADEASGSAAAKGDSAPAAKVSGDGPPPSDPRLALACDRLVVEGTVARVEPQDAPWTRILLTVTRSYKPGHGPSRVTFLLDDGAEPAPRPGQHVLVEVGRGADNASRWAVGDARVAANRAWIVKALPRARHTTCPPDASTSEP